MNYVCENYEINKEEAEDRSAALAAYAGKIVLRCRFTTGG